MCIHIASPQNTAVNYTTKPSSLTNQPLSILLFPRRWTNSRRSPRQMSWRRSPLTTRRTSRFKLNSRFCCHSSLRRAARFFDTPGMRNGSTLGTNAAKVFNRDLEDFIGVVEKLSTVLDPQFTASSILMFKEFAHLRSVRRSWGGALCPSSVCVRVHDPMYILVLPQHDQERAVLLPFVYGEDARFNTWSGCQLKVTFECTITTLTILNVWCTPASWADTGLFSRTRPGSDSNSTHPYTRSHWQ